MVSMMKRKVHTKHFLTKINGCLKQSTYAIEAVSPTGCFFHGTSISLERNINKLWLCRLGHLADISFKNEKVSLAHKTADSVCCQWQNSNFQTKIRTSENLTVTVSLTASLQRHSVDAIGYNVKEHNLLMLYNKMPTLWQISVTYWGNVFQMTKPQCYKTVCK